MSSGMTPHSTTDDGRYLETRDIVVLASSTFVLGVITGLLLKDAARHMLEHARDTLAYREADTIVYDENLPESLARREPAPDARQPRFGGTGALGVSPAAIVSGRRADGES